MDVFPTSPARLRTSELARATGYSAQQVRDLERLGVIPPAIRTGNGYRGFGPVHVLALRAYRRLADAVGPVVARRVLSRARALPLADAVALISSLHVGLAREREDALAALQALRTIQANADDPLDDTAMTITGLADALGVRPSALRFWEAEDLVAPERIGSLAARRYPPAAIREARIVAALRQAGYRIPAIRGTIHAIRRLENLDDPINILQERLATIAQRTLALLTAGSEVVEFVRAESSSIAAVSDSETEGRQSSV